MKRRTKYIFLFITLLLAGPIYELTADLSAESSMTATVEVVEEKSDSVVTRFPVSPTVPEQYDDLNANYPIDLKNPEDFGDNFEYNPATNRYEIRSKVGGSDVTTPVSLTRDEYLDYTLKKSMNAYFKVRNDEETSGEADKKKDALSPFDFNFDLGPADKIFGPGGVRLQPHGSVNTKIGVSHTKIGDPTMTERNRNRWAFDFDPDIQVSANASIGDKMNFDLNYNTQSTFDYDSKKLKLAYAGKEDEIVKILEAGNVSMNTTNSLIRGGAALFGIKTQLQFGKLTVDAIFSQQNSQSRTTSSKGSVQTTPFEITVDNYDENMHFFLTHYFPAIYDTAMSKLPYIRSGILIDQLEVWVTNKRSNYDQARNIAAFADLGESVQISNPNVVQSNWSAGTPAIPYNRANTLYEKLLADPALREISQVNQSLESMNLTGGQDYEKIESARKLDYSEYMLNQRLGYISLRMPLQPDEALAVAFSYQYNGQTYQVGEFSNQDPANPNATLFLKLIKGTAQSPGMPGWHLMMKNVYTISKRGSLSPDKFRLDIKYQNDTSGVYLNYITEGAIANQRLLNVENLDRLDARQEPYPDGFFDYVDSLTVFSQTGKIVFPVLQPFGKHLRDKIANDSIADKYVYQELYDTTLTVARQAAEKNKFILTGEYKGSNGSSIEAGGYNLAKGSVVVTANGVRLKENVDYTVNYSTGSVDIINPAYENANIQVSSEDQSGLGMQRKTMMGFNLNYAFSPKFNIGATLMNLSEMPMTMKVEPGQESINNTLFGFNTNYSTQSQWLTKMLDKLPFVELTAPSQITLNAEYAQLIPGHYKSKWGGDYSYVDDFERAKMSIDLRSPYSWTLSATPSMFSESKKTNNLEYGNNRALLAWYYIDGLFTRKSSLTPTHIKNDDEQLSNHYVREIREEELYPNKDVRYNEASTIPVLNLAYYPTERGPYNLDANGMNPDGTLMNPQNRWGGIFRKIESGNTDFEANNVEHIEFWLMDPFLYNSNASGGDLYFNLGDVSEDILKDEKKFFENGLPVDGDKSKVEETVWGYVPKQQSTVYAFDSQGENRQKQDVGFNGLSSADEREFKAYKDYLDALRSKLEPSAYAKIEADPAGDNFHYFRGSDYDQMQTPILGRYKYYNGTEGNSANADDTSESYTTAAKINPDVEDINQDNTLNENERYFQYKVSIRPSDLEIGRNFVVDKRITRPKLKNGKSEEVTWYQFKIPIHSYEEPPIGNIRDFQSIRFIRMFLTNFLDSTVLRFGTLELVRGEWRAYTQELNQPNLPPDPNTEISISTVNIEENGDKQPVNYIMPPGVNRMTDPGQPQLIMQNEQSLAAKVKDLATGDARATYKNIHLDTRQYRRFQMFVHAENFENADDPVNDNEFSVFLRLGSDYKSNYYEYEIPLKITPPGNYNSASSNEREMVWPYANMFDFPFELLTNLKLKRNKEKRKAGSDVSYTSSFSDYDPQKPMNTITVKGNPSLSEIKVIMIGVRNNSKTKKSIEFWTDEMRLTEFNEDGGWAGNATLFVGLSDLGSINLAGRKETAGFGGLDQGIMDRNLDDKQMVSVSTQVELGKFFPEKAKINLPFYYSYSEELVSPKYNPLDQDILLTDALAAMETQAEKDSIRSFAIDRVMNRSLEFNNVRAGITSKTPMPYDPANFSFGYSFNESDIRNATTEYDRQTGHRVLLGYIYSPPLKPWKPFDKKSKSNDKNQTAKPTISGNSKNNFLKELQIGFLPKSIALNSDINRNYYELQLRDIGNMSDVKMPVSFREDFYWTRTTAIGWDLTKNLRFNFNNGTQARVDAPHVQVNKSFNYDKYQLWKDSVLMSLRDLGTPINYNQQFSATWQLPFKAIPALNFMSGDLKYDAQYNWERGAVIDIPDIEIGNKITNQRNMGLNNLAINFVTLYNKSKFLESANKKYTLNRPNNTRNTNQRNNRQTDDRAKKAAEEKKNKKYEGEVTLNPDSTTILKHSLNNKRIRVTARGADGRLYAVNYKAIDANTIRINNKDSVKLKVNIAQLPPLDDLAWYKVAQVVARGLMMVRNVSVSYDLTQGMLIPGFRPETGDFFGQGGTAMGTAPGFDFAFGLNDESYLEKAAARDWLINDQMSITPALFNKTQTFRMTAVLEPFVGMKINLNANRISADEQQIDYMYDGMPKRFNGNFNMTTIALGSAFEKSDANNGYRSKTFNTFLENREILVQRLQSRYNQAVPGYSGGVEPNSTDVLVPAFLAAYTGGNARTASLDFFPSLLRLLPNWKATYDGLIQIPFINKYFKTFSLEHEYKCNYRVGSYTSYPGWTSAADGIGYIQDMAGQSIATSPYNVMSVSIEEKFDPFIRINSVLLNNMTFKVDYKTGRNINLNIASYQIVETTSTEVSANIGYRIDHFDKIIKFPKKTNANFNNELRISGGFSYRMNQSLNRKIQDGFTQPTTGNSQTMINLTADYTLSRMITLQAFFDRQVSRPLVSATSFPQAKSAFGVSLKVSLMQ